MTWATVEDTGDATLYFVPDGHRYAGRILAGGLAPYSDDRGFSWQRALTVPPMFIYDFVSLPPASRLPGTASGRDPAAPSGWPEGRIVAGASAGVMITEDGGATYQLSDFASFGHHVHHVTLVRRPDTHPRGPGPRLIALRDGAPSGVATYVSDDGGTTWQQGVDLIEPNDGGVAWRAARGLHALSEVGEADPGGGGRALAALARGHLYVTEDAGDTWHVVGRAPEMFAGGKDGYGTVNSTEIGPDGRLYVAVTGNGQPRWVWRTGQPVVTVEAGPDALPSIGLAVRPNPAGTRAEVIVTLLTGALVRVSVVDAQGREVQVVRSGLLAAGSTPLGLDLSAMASGAYVVVAETAGRRITANLSVVR